MLQPAGFSKRGRKFRRFSEGNLALIELQRSVRSDSAAIQFTINVGIVSGRLLQERGLDLKKVGCSHAHLNERIGFFLSDPQDKWWELDDSTEASGAICEITALIREKVLPFLDRHLPDAGLIDLWKTGRSPGLTEGQRVRYLSQLSS
ncbi:DUF4304 domain-containing protein [Sphingomonas oleivorans]|uniref:DUF4304 domain-containing protein n=1 Tax=Sphingomonas oleivorans TaxID=1735121 RepID=UPI001FAF1424|nr:DUF4304 domain-containing protein [Sphingomonas oleivorans]